MGVKLWLCVNSGTFTTAIVKAPREGCDHGVDKKMGLLLGAVKQTLLGEIQHMRTYVHTHAHRHTLFTEIGSQSHKWQTKVWIAPKSNLANQCVLLGVTYRKTGEGLQEQKPFKNSYITKGHPNIVTAHPSWKPGACYTAFRQLSSLESVLLCFFQASWLVSAFF